MHDMRLIAPDATTLNFRVKDGRIVMGDRAAQFLIGRSVADTLAWAEKNHGLVQMPPLRLTQLSLRIVRGLAHPLQPHQRGVRARKRARSLR
jgi:hypothetical protein